MKFIPFKDLVSVTSQISVNSQIQDVPGIIVLLDRRFNLFYVYKTSEIHSKLFSIADELESRCFHNLNLHLTYHWDIDNLHFFYFPVEDLVDGSYSLSGFEEVERAFNVILEACPKTGFRNFYVLNPEFHFYPAEIFDYEPPVFDDVELTGMYLDKKFPVLYDDRVLDHQDAFVDICIVIWTAIGRPITYRDKVYENLGELAKKDDEDDPSLIIEIGEQLRESNGAWPGDVFVKQT